MSTRSERIAAHIAARIMRNTKKRFSALHADAIGDIMAQELGSNDGAVKVNRSQGSPADGVKPSSNPTTSDMSVSSQVNVGPTKKVDFKDLKTGEDFRSKGAQPDPLAGNDRAPRSETGTKGA